MIEIDLAEIQRADPPLLLMSNSTQCGIEPLSYDCLV